MYDDLTTCTVHNNDTVTMHRCKLENDNSLNGTIASTKQRVPVVAYSHYMAHTDYNPSAIFLFVLMFVYL